MPTVTMLEAKSTLSRLLEAVESGKEAEFIIARNGKPVARLVPLERPPAGQRIGVAKGLFVASSDINGGDEVIETLFSGTPA